MKTQSIMAKLFIALLLLGSAGCANQAAQGVTEETKYLTYVKPGQVMPVMQFTDIQGSHIDLADSNKNKLVVLFATWCPDSQRAIKAILVSDLRLDNNLEIFAIGREENKASLELFAKKYHTDFPLIADVDRRIYSQFANAGVPRLILLDGDNRIVKTIIAEGKQPLGQVVW